VLSKKLNFTCKVIQTHDIKSCVYFYDVTLIDIDTLFLSDFKLTEVHSHRFGDTIAFSVFDESDFTTKIVFKSSLRKLYGHHHELVDRYRISVSQMTTDMIHLS
jgi:hypothetical protein